MNYNRIFPDISEDSWEEIQELESAVKDYDMWEKAKKNKYLKVTENLRTYQDNHVLREVLIESANLVMDFDRNIYAFLSKRESERTELLIVPSEIPFFLGEEIYLIMNDNVIFLFSYVEEYNVFQYEAILFIKKINNWNKNKIIGHYEILYSQIQTEQFEIFFGLSLDEIHEKAIQWEEQFKTIPKEYDYGNLEDILKQLAGILAINNFK